MVRLVPFFDGRRSGWEFADQFARLTAGAPVTELDKALEENERLRGELADAQLHVQQLIDERNRLEQELADR